MLIEISMMRDSPVSVLKMKEMRNDISYSW